MKKVKTALAALLIGALGALCFISCSLANVPKPDVPEQKKVVNATKEKQYDPYAEFGNTEDRIAAPWLDTKFRGICIMKALPR